MTPCYSIYPAVFQSELASLSARAVMQSALTLASEGLALEIPASGCVPVRIRELDEMETRVTCSECVLDPALITHFLKKTRS